MSGGTELETDFPCLKRKPYLPGFVVLADDEAGNRDAEIYSQIGACPWQL